VPDREGTRALAPLDRDDGVGGSAVVPLAERRAVDARDGVAWHHTADVHTAASLSRLQTVTGE
jgi:hypothetical protein